MRPRVAVLSPYWDFWASRVRGDLRGDRVQLAAEVSAALPGVEVVAEELLDGSDADHAAMARVRTARPDVALVVQSMAVPPGWTVRSLETVPELPLVVWGVHRRSGPPIGYDHSDIAVEGATVGVPQLVNVLGRRGRRHVLVVGRLDDERCRRRVTAEVRAGAAAGRIGRARLLRVGTPMPGYACVDVDDDELRRGTGIHAEHVDPARLQALYRDAGPEAVERVARETEATFELEDGIAPGDDGLRRSLRLAAALEQLDAETGAAAGALNCHVPELRYADEPGVTACFALGRETTRGVPWTCTGDVLTAVAMLTAKALGAAAVYHELEALDYDRDEALIANSGEHDLAFVAAGTRPRLERNRWFADDPRVGVCACFTGTPGPATIVGFTPHPEERSGFRYVVAEGTLTGRSFPHSGTVNGAFRFGDGSEPVDVAWQRWAEAGVNHHSSASLGHLGDAVAAVAAELGVGIVRVS